MLHLITGTVGAVKAATVSAFVAGAAACF